MCGMGSWQRRRPGGRKVWSWLAFAVAVPKAFRPRLHKPTGAATSPRRSHRGPGPQTPRVFDKLATLVLGSGCACKVCNSTNGLVQAPLPDGLSGLAPRGLYALPVLL